MGQDKLFLSVGNRTLLDRMYETLSERFDSVKIAARSQTKFTGLPYQVVVDSPKAKGPMAGLIASLEDCEDYPDQSCFVCAVDLPDLSIELIDRLLTAYKGEDYLGVEEPESGVEQPTGSIQPLCGIWSKNSLPSLYELAASGNYRLADLLSRISTRSLTLPAGQWRNLNHPADLDQSGVANG